MLITLGFSGFLPKRGIRKVASGNHTAPPQLRPYGASRATPLTFPQLERCLWHLYCKTHSPPLQGFAGYALDGAFGTLGTTKDLLHSLRLEFFMPAFSHAQAFNRNST